MTTASRHIYAAEFAKLRTLRSTWTTVVGSALLSVLLAYVVASQQVTEWHTMTTAQRADIDPIATSLVGVLFTTVIFGSLAVRSFTGEYSSSMIQLTMSAMPARRSVVVAKAVIIGSIALVTALVANVASFLVGQHVMASVGASAEFSDPGVVRSILLGSIAVSATAVLGVGLGGIVRRTAIGTTLLAVAIIGSQIFTGIAPQNAQRYLPGNALQAMVTGHTTTELLAPTTALLTFGIYATTALVAASLLVHRRDV
jgi:ABC-2 type transport system permease protein